MGVQASIRIQTSVRFIVSVVRILAAIVIFFGLPACSLQHTALRSYDTLQQHINGTEVSRQTQAKLPRTARIYFAQQVPSTHVQQYYPSLLTHITLLAREEIAHHFLEVEYAPQPITYPQALALATVTKAEVLALLTVETMREARSSTPEIWLKNDRWDEGVARDELDLSLTLIDVQSGRVMDVIHSHRESGGWQMKDHKVLDLAKPSLAAMLMALQGR